MARCAAATLPRDSMSREDGRGLPRPLTPGARPVDAGLGVLVRHRAGAAPARPRPVVLWAS